MATKTTLTRFELYWGSLKVDTIDYSLHLSRRKPELNTALGIIRGSIDSYNKTTGNTITRFTILHYETTTVKNDSLKLIARYNYLGESIAL